MLASPVEGQSGLQNCIARKLDQRRYRRGMNAALPGQPPEELRPQAVDVGEFRQGSPVSRWALARYLVGRAMAESLSRSLLLVALAILALAAVVGWVLHATFWAVVLAVMALVVLAMRAGLRAVLRRLTAADQIQPIEQRLRSLVSDTRGDVLRELRRVGLPGHSWTLPLLALRFFGRRRRRDTVARLRRFDLDRVVPKARLDELHLLLRTAVGRG
jgi:membrane protein implicated in regulation of membrane protease activity